MDVFDADWKLEISLNSQSEDLYQTQPPQIVMVRGSNETVHLVLQAATNYFRGRFVDSFGLGVSNVGISAFRFEEAAHTRTISNTNGDFALAIFPGLWGVSFDKVDGFLSPGSPFLYVQPGRDPHPMEILLQAVTVTLSGSVTDINSNAVPLLSGPLGARALTC